jgi:predicted DNA-binding protein
VDYKQTNQNTKHINLRIPINVYNYIQNLSKQQERTISQQIRYMLEKHIDILEKK